MILMPIIPTSKIDPSGQNRYSREAEKEFNARIRGVRLEFEKKLKSFKKYTITPNSILPNRQYFYQINEVELNQAMQELSDYVADQMGGGNQDNWFYKSYIEPAYRRGTALEYSNLLHQSSIFASQTLGARMLSSHYLNRVALVRFRVFEEMNGLTAKIKTEMSRALSDGISQGLSIKKISDRLEKIEGINQNRAKTIARTEILTAYRRARVDESEQAMQDYGLTTKLLWISAFASTTRKWHASRHGETYTAEEVREFYSKDGNAINCMCSQVSVLVDSDGRVINDILSKRLIKMRSSANDYKESLSNTG